MRVMAKIIGVKHIKRVISIQLNFSFLQMGESVDSAAPLPSPPPQLPFLGIPPSRTLEHIVNA